MRILTAVYKLVTPAFHDSKGKAPEDLKRQGLRPPTIKRLVAYWWRADQWRVFWQQAQAEIPDADRSTQLARALVCLHREQLRLFGAAAGADGSGGQGVFQFTGCCTDVSACSVYDLARSTPCVNRDDATAAQAWLGYLAGPALFRTRWLQPAIGTCELTVKCFFRPGRPAMDAPTVRAEGPGQEQDCRQIARAMWLLGMFGGVGLRSRRGFGSLALQALTLDDSPLDDWGLAVPLDAAQWLACNESMLARNRDQPAVLADRYPPFTAFGPGSKFHLMYPLPTLHPYPSALRILSDWGEKFLAFRSNGWSEEGLRYYGPKVAPKPVVPPPSASRPRFFDDHDQLLEFAKAKVRDKAKPDPTRRVRRQVFGLPHPYFFSSVRNADRKGTSLSIDAFMANGDPEVKLRRASPLFCHVHQFPDGGLAIATLVMPAQFLPTGAVTKVDKTVVSGVAADAESWQPMDDWLDALPIDDHV